MQKGQISISPRGGNFQFSAGGERYMYLKKNLPLDLCMLLQANKNILCKYQIRMQNMY